jgi:hypothetical protein
MFLVEIGAGLAAGSASLQADALDFFGDAANYAISLLVVGLALRYRAMAALAKGATTGLLGSGSSARSSGTRCTAPCQVPLLWVRSDLQLSQQTQFPSGCSGRIGTVTQTCAPRGFAPAMTSLETLPFCLLRLVSSVRARVGRMLLLRPS